MHLSVIKICAAVAVRLVALGAHAESYNQVSLCASTWLIRALAGPQKSTKKKQVMTLLLYSFWLVEKCKNEVLTSAKFLHNVALDLGHFIDLSQPLRKIKALADNTYTEMETYDKCVNVSVRDAYM